MLPAPPPAPWCPSPQEAHTLLSAGTLALAHQRLGWPLLVPVQVRLQERCILFVVYIQPGEAQAEGPLSASGLSSTRTWELGRAEAVLGRKGQRRELIDDHLTVSTMYSLCCTHYAPQSVQDAVRDAYQGVAVGPGGAALRFESDSLHASRLPTQLLQVGGGGH